jgi:RsiW-degrading membrane proteinase PrsW (M82 family)
VPGFLFRNFPEEFFNEPLDGIVYAVVLAMGYASVENMLYVAAYGINTTILRAFTAVPAHLVFAIVQGYYLGRARFMPEQKLESDNQRTWVFPLSCTAPTTSSSCNSHRAVRPCRRRFRLYLLVLL